MEEIKLPEPKEIGTKSLEEVLNERRSYRLFKNKPVSLEELSQLLWAMQGKNNHGKRCAPSAGATYPLELFIVIKNVREIKKGIYKYIQKKHSIELLKEGSFEKQVSMACLMQPQILMAALNIIITAVMERTTSKYGERGKRYVYLDCGLASENLCLQATSIGLGTVYIGAFEDEKLKHVLGIEEQPLGVFPIGRIGTVSKISPF